VVLSVQPFDDSPAQRAPENPRRKSASPRQPAEPAPPARSDDPVAVLQGLIENIHANRLTGLPPRIRGFVALVRQARSLEPLQVACRSMSRHCITFRYRVESRHAFGTLLQAAVHDLHALLNDGETEPLGTVDPPQTDAVWPALRGGPLHVLLAHRPDRDPRGRLDSAALGGLLKLFRDPKHLQPGMRLVIFGEVVGADGDPEGVAAWRRAADLLFPHLPERVGMVLSGVPEGFALPDDPVHYVELAELEGTPSAADAPAAGEAAARFQPAELVADVPTTQDHLDREAYAASLAAFLLHPDTAPPITIGLYGRWGSGKSSFWNLLKRLMVLETAQDIADGLPTWRRVMFRLRRRPPRSKLDQYGPASVTIDSRGFPLYRGFPITFAESERMAERRIVTLAFNAWQFDDAKQTWAGLASTVSARLENALPPWRRQWMRLKYAWRSNRSDVLLNFGLPVLLLALAAVVLLPWLTPQRVTELAPKGEGNENPLQGLLKAVLPAGSLLLLVWTVGWRLVEVVKPVSERVAGYMKRTDYRADMGYQHRVIDDLKFLLSELEAARPGCRVLVYIDDLDRCSDEKIVEILRATILILADCRLFVMFGMDTDMIRRAIVAHYEKMKVPLADPQAFAESYLRKIVQIALHLPETQPERRFTLVESMFSDAARQAFRERDTARESGTASSVASAGGAEALSYDLSSIRRLVKVETVEDTADELAALAELKDYLPDNARELKRFVNTHRFLKILLSASGASWSGRRQQALVKWLLFCTNWPARVDDVLGYAREHPDAVDCLKPACAAAGWDEVLGDFPGLGVPIPAAELLGDFDMAARLSQVVEWRRPEAPAAEKAKVQLPGPVVAVAEP
jgi:hypothetical protein